MTSNDTLSLTEELMRMPKEPIDGLEIATGRQFFWYSTIALIFPLATGLCFTLSVYAIHGEPWWSAACLLLIMTSLMIIVWLTSLTKLIRDNRELSKLAAGYYLAAWKIPQEQWNAVQQDWRGAVENACWWVFRILPAIGFVGAIAGVLLDVVAGGESGMNVFPVIFPQGLNTVGYTVIGVILAFAIARCIRFFANIRQQVEDHGVPQVVVSEEALYVTGGLYRKSALTDLVEVKQLETPVDSLSFVFETVGDAVVRNAVVVPVPKEERRKAKALRRMLSEPRHAGGEPEAVTT